MACTYLGSRSFDSGTRPFASADYNHANVNASALDAHTGAYSLGVMAGNAIWGRIAVTGTPANLGVGLWINPDAGYTSNGFWVRLQLTSGEYIDFRWDTTNKTVDAYVDGVKVDDGSEVVSSADWFNFQAYVVVADSGSIDTKIDGIDDISYSGDTLPAGASAEIEYIYLYSVDSASFYMDDVIWGTGDFTGDVRCEWKVPTADTAVDDWTASAGDSYSCIDEVPASAADYIYTDINADEVELELADWDGSGKTPVLVTAWARALQDAATGEALKVGVDSNAVDDVTQHNMGASAEYYDHVMLQNPDGPAAWDDAAIDALKLRYEAVI